MKGNRPVLGIWSNDANASLHISPYIYYSNDVRFRATVGHELIHAYHSYTIWNKVSSYSETVAYTYTYNVYMANGYYQEALDTRYTQMKKGYWTGAPKQYWQLPVIFSVYK